MEIKQRRYLFADVLKAIGALLVLNSHFDVLYPISALGTGGSLGNGLFFAVSGFLLWPIKDDAAGWIGKKVRRLYIPAILMTVFDMLVTERGFLTARNAVFVFVWPTIYWFVGGIFLLYLLYYALRGVTAKRQFGLLFAALLLIYAVGYFCLDTSFWVVESGWEIDAYGLHRFFAGSFRLIYGFAMMMIGKYVRIHVDFSEIRPRVCLLNACGGGISLYAVKYLMAAFSPTMHIQFLNQLSVMWFVTAMMLWGAAVELKLEKMRDGCLLRAAARLSAVTLEFYIVQGFVLSVAKNIWFPFNIAAAVGMTVICSTVLHGAAVWIEKTIVCTKKN